MRRLTLREYQPSEPIELTSDELVNLNRIIPSLTITPSADRPGCFEVTPGSWVGAIRIGSLSIEILPKIPVERLLFLISYSAHIQTWRSLPFSAVEDQSIVEAIISVFLRLARKTFHWGLLHGYRRQDDSLNTVRGRIRFDDQIRNYYGLFPPVEVSYDYFTEDIEENRLIKAAVWKLGRLRTRSGSLRRGLLELDTVMAGVQRVEYDPRSLPTVLYTRLNEHYRHTVELAKLILRSTSFELQHGNVQAAALLFNMNTVFEDFVVVALREVLRLRPLTFPQEVQGRRLWFDDGDLIPLYPDISWWDGNDCCFVGDVKYKRTRLKGAPNADLYQMLAYLTSTGLSAGMLIYAAGESDTGSINVRIANKRIEIVTLDLDVSPSELLDQIRSIACRIRSLKIAARVPAKPAAVATELT